MFSLQAGKPFVFWFTFCNKFRPAPSNCFTFFNPLAKFFIIFEIQARFSYNKLEITCCKSIVRIYLVSKSKGKNKNLTIYITQFESSDAIILVFINEKTMLQPHTKHTIRGECRSCRYTTQISLKYSAYR